MLFTIISFYKVVLQHLPNFYLLLLHCKQLLHFLSEKFVRFDAMVSCLQLVRRLDNRRAGNHLTFGCNFLSELLRLGHWTHLVHEHCPLQIHAIFLH